MLLCRICLGGMDKCRWETVGMLEMNAQSIIHEGRLSGTEYLQIAQMHKARGMPILGKYQETQSK